MPNKEKMLTISDLLLFCEQNHFLHFSSKDKNEILCVQVPAKIGFSSDETEDKNLEGLVPVVLNACHDQQNLNGSNIYTENMERAIPSFQLRPILAAIHKNEDGWDFGSHEMEVIDDPFNEGKKRVEYKEHSVGIVFGDVHLEYDEEAEVNRVIAHGYLYSDYGNGAVEILQARGSVACSVELCIREMSYNAKEKFLDLIDFYFNGVTLLGSDVKPGMAGSNVTLQDFSMENNSMIPEGVQNMDIPMSLKEAGKSGKEGGNGLGKFEELLEKYGKTADEISFEHEGLSDEELEAKFAEAFGESEDEPDKEPEGETGHDTSGEGADGEDETDGGEPEGETDGEGEPEEESEDEPVDEPKDGSDDPAPAFERRKLVNEINGGVSIAFEISHEDIRSALYNLLMSWEEEDNEWYWINAVFDSYVVYSNWDESVIFRQDYTVDGDNVALADSRTRLYKEYLTTSEKDALEEMRSNYTALQNKVKEFESERDKADKEAIFADEAYSEYIHEKEFEDLIKNSAQYSVQDCRVKAELLFAHYVKEKGSYKKPEKAPTPVAVHMPFMQEAKDEPYGSLFKNQN